MDHFKVVAALTPALFGWLFVKITAHEVGHAVMARLVGFTPSAIDVGKGAVLCKFRVFGIQTTLHTLPLGGFAHINLPPLVKLRWRGALFSIGGIAADSLSLGLLLLLVTLILREGSNMGLLSFTLWYLIFFQSVSLLISLIPRDIHIRGLVIPNDAKQFCQYVTGGTDALYQAAYAEYEEDIRKTDPNFEIKDSWFIKDNHGRFKTIVDLSKEQAEGKHRSVVEQYLSILQCPSIARGERAVFLDRIACIAVVDGQQEFLNPALAWAREAHELFPHLPTLRGTYGGALVESGAYIEATEMLTPLTAEGNTPIDRSISACYLAKAHHHLGNITEAEAFLKLGKALKASCGVCERIEKELKEGSVELKPETHFNDPAREPSR
jgi:hypothetical protein